MPRRVKTMSRRPAKIRPLTYREQKLVEQNMPLVGFVLRTLWRSTFIRLQLGTLEEAEQVGYVGLCKAVKGFDRKRGFRFSTYAYSCIRQAIVSAAQDGGLVRVPRYQQLQGSSYKRPWVDWLPDKLEAPEREPRDYLENERLARAIGRLCLRERELIQLRFGLVQRPRLKMPALSQAKTLPGETLEEISIRWGISRERVRQIEIRAMARLRKEMAVA